MNTCKWCGTAANNGNHFKSCVKYKEGVLNFKQKLSETEDEVLCNYKDGMSIADIMVRLDNRAASQKFRSIIDDFLKSKNVHEGLRYTNKRTEKTRATTLARHGVLNIGCTKQFGWNITNKIEYKKLSALTDQFEKYADEVRRITKKSLKNKYIEEYCEYTGIKFADIILGKMVNPNDPAKRSVDHKIPIIWGYLNGVDAEVIGDESNLSYVLKYVNTVKGNTLYDSFIPLCVKIRKIFKDEGHESN